MGLSRAQEPVAGLHEVNHLEGVFSVANANYFPTFLDPFTTQERTGSQQECLFKK